MSAEPDDAALLHAHVQGDPEAFAELVRRHRDRLWAVALRTTGDAEDAADALQEALISAFRRAGSYRSEALVTTWLHRIVVNACLDRLRRRGVRLAALPLADEHVAGRLGSVSGEPESAARRIDVSAALATLHPDQRAALVLVDMHGYSVAEAAHMLGCAEGTVKSRCSRGRSQLARILAGYARNQRPDFDVQSSSAGSPGLPRPSSAVDEGPQP
jgi:RNA polymerase sigma-70 factor (ECF subfamily)